MTSVLDTKVFSSCLTMSFTMDVQNLILFSIFWAKNVAASSIKYTLLST
jgi:hypothetical protein